VLNPPAYSGIPRTNDRSLFKSRATSGCSKRPLAGHLLSLVQASPHVCRRPAVDAVIAQFLFPLLVPHIVS
jgi:hypothetical protein